MCILSKVACLAKSQGIQSATRVLAASGFLLTAQPMVAIPAQAFGVVLFVSVIADHSSLALNSNQGAVVFISRFYLTLGGFGVWSEKEFDVMV